MTGAESSDADTASDFVGVYDDHVYDVYSFLAYRTRSREDAQDLTQLSFERALAAWERFDPRRASARTWLISIARNLLIDHYRADRSARRQPLDPVAAETGALGVVESEPRGLGLAPDLEQALEALDDRERELIALRFGGELTGPEIAELTGLTLANVQQILSRTLRKLRQRLESAAVASGGG